MDKLHYYVCQMDQLLAKYVKIAEGNSGHILEVDKSMENMRFMTNMNDQYTNESDNKDNSNDDVEDIDPGDKLVDYFNNGNNCNNDDVSDDDLIYIQYMICSAFVPRYDISHLPGHRRSEGASAQRRRS